MSRPTAVNDVRGHRPHYVRASAQRHFDPRTGTYNWHAANTRNLKFGVGRAKVGGQGCSAWIGDSILAGYNNGQFSPAEVNRQLAIPIAVRDALAAKGVPTAGTGLVRIIDNAEIDYRWSNSGTWTAQKAYATTTVAASAATLIPDRSGSLVTVWYWDAGQTFTISVDGASSGAGFATIVAPGTPGGLWRKAVLIPPSRIVAGSSTIVVTLTSGTYITIGAEVWTPNAGYTVHNIAQGGSSASGSGTGSWSDLSATGSLLPAYIKLIQGGARTVADGVFTALGTTIGSATGFSIADIGKEIVLPYNHHEVPPNTYVKSIIDATHAEMSNAAVAGSTGTGFTVTIGRPVDAVFIELGANDHPGTMSNPTVADVIAALRIIVGQVKTSITDVILIIENQENSATLIPDAQWEAYCGALYDLADELDLPLWDMRHLVGNWTTAVTTGVAGDNGGHMRAGSYANLAQILAEVIAA